MSNVAIIGGGASGLVAAIAAARNNRRVTVYESGERPGRKILATGNGRCNMTNINACAEHYHGHDTDFILGAVNRFWVRETIEFFEELGIVAKTEDGGRVYPYSDQASSVLDVLRFEIERIGVRVVGSFEVKTVTKQGGIFTIKAYNGQTAQADKVIIATGGRAAPNLGSKGAGYDILSSFGHKITDLSPSLVQIRTETDTVKKLRGIKLDAKAALGGRIEYGDVLFTEYGLSGSAVFALSSGFEAQDIISLDIMPEYSQEKLYNMLSSRVKKIPAPTLENFFAGMLNKRVGQVLLKTVGAEPLSRSVSALTPREIEKLCHIIKKWDFKITGTMSWNNAQVTKGGARTDEFCADTMESKLLKGLYAVGEVLDIDGDCGGYNLQWAWSSGYIAGSSV